MTSVPDILRRLDIDALSPMQEAMVGAATAGEPLVLLAPTGSGKTLAFLLAALCRRGTSGGSIAVVSPSRELAMQSEALFRRMRPEEAGRTLTSAVVVGGHAAKAESARLRDACPDALFATPGRLLDHIDKGRIDTAAFRLLVLDEFDKCLELGFREEMLALVGRFSGAMTWFVSATPADADAAAAFRLDAARLLDFSTSAPTAEGATDVGGRLEVSVVRSPERDKLQALARLLTGLGAAPSMVFVGFRESAVRVGSYLRAQGFAAEIYHGGLEQRDRERALYRFRAGGSNVLVCTDLAARGLDIPEVSAVVHYHAALDAAAYAHRNGRSTRWEGAGTAYLLLGPDETLPAFAAPTIAETPLEAQIRPAQPLWATVYIGRGRRQKLSRGDVAGFFCKVGGLQGDDIGRIDVGPDYAYVALRRSCLRAALRAVRGQKIKGMRTIIEEMR